MTKGSVVEAIALAKQRFAQYFPFDLDDASWQQLFDAHRTGDVLEAIRRTSTARDKRAERVYTSLLYWIGKLEHERDEKESPEWPPRNVIPKN
jgi:hypothetical protein